LEIREYKALFLKHLKKRIKTKEPKNLYSPITYILNLGGKRLRPILTLMSCDLFGGDRLKALDAALAIEMFHNFSLVHDDIMDDASLRRGKKTVHEKWNLNTGILSGDAMLVLSNQLFESYKGDQFKRLISLFNQTALEVCEGQQYDIDFETRVNISIKEYIKMITLKTAVLVATSLKIGAIIALTDKDNLNNIYDYGINLGIAFQLQDDYLDVFGDDDFGKRKAGDIVENKKTFMFLKTLELANTKDKAELLNMYDLAEFSKKKINSVIELFRKYEMPKLMEEEIKKYTFKAQENIHNLSLQENKKNVLVNFADQLMQRTV
jgi:geranylgeranyl diphosphate synthase type II